MLGRGLTAVPIEELHDYLTEHLCDSDRLIIEKIVNCCIARKASAVFLFIRFIAGNIKCEAFMPIYNKEKLLEEYSGSYKKNIGQSIFLGAKLMRTKKELEDKEAWRAIFNRAVRVGGWSEECSMLVFHKKGYK